MRPALSLTDDRFSIILDRDESTLSTDMDVSPAQPWFRTSIDRPSPPTGILWKRDEWLLPFFFFKVDSFDGSNGSISFLFFFENTRKLGTDLPHSSPLRAHIDENTLDKCIRGLQKWFLCHHFGSKKSWFGSWWSELRQPSNRKDAHKIGGGQYQARFFFSLL